MLKKTTIIFLLLFFLINICSEYSSAFLFKRNKASKQPTNNTEKTVQQKDEKKILVVEIFASWCPGCKNIQPILDQLKKELSQINIIQLDVSTPSKAEASRKLAKELKIISFYDANKSKTATVGIVTPTASEVIAVLYNDNNVNAYKAAVQEAEKKESEFTNPQL